jgi:YbbR domain-containing protein
MKKKNKPNWFLRILTILFIVFIALLFANQNGYYESTIAKKTILTEESIKQFESDVKENKPIDINDYTITEEKDYSNKTTDLGIFISDKVEKIMSSGISSLVDMLKKLFT